MVEPRPGALVLQVYAKVNLTLEVLGRRPDGFHEVRTVLQSISLADRLTLQPAGGLSLSCSNSELEGEDNLALKAARLLRDRAKISVGASLVLEKGIPVAAGLGGGSADAAAALVGLNLMWDLGRSREDLFPLAAALGSDVPFFLQGGTALGSGRGEQLEALPFPGRRWLVLLAPPADLPNKTARLYRALRPEDCRDGSHSEALAGALRAGGPLPPDLLVNSFATVAADVFPDLARYASALEDAGASAVQLSGAGPTVFTMVESEVHGRAVAEALTARGFAPLVAHTVAQGWELLSNE